jgi:rhodanese-related sulfurtransferase
MASACITPLGAADNVRTRAEWTYVGMPDLGSLSKRAITFPDQTINPRFPERLAGELGALGVKLDDDLFFICRSGGRSLAAAKAIGSYGLPRLPQRRRRL